MIKDDSRNYRLISTTAHEDGTVDLHLENIENGNQITLLKAYPVSVEFPNWSDVDSLPLFQVIHMDYLPDESAEERRWDNFMEEKENLPEEYYRFSIASPGAFASEIAVPQILHSPPKQDFQPPSNAEVQFMRLPMTPELAWFNSYLHNGVRPKWQDFSIQKDVKENTEKESE